METREFYSPGQIYVSSFLGGPLAAIYFLSNKLKRLGNDTAKVFTIAVGLLAPTALILLLFQLPDDFPNYGDSLAVFCYCVCGRPAVSGFLAGEGGFVA